MDIPYRFTRHQVPRAARADAERQDALILIKNASSLRLTYQIRVLASRASESRKKLVISVPAGCRIHRTLRDFQKEHPRIIRFEKG